MAQPILVTDAPTSANDQLAEVGQVLEMCRALLRAPGVKTFADDEAFILNEINPALVKLHQAASLLQSLSAELARETADHQHTVDVYRNEIEPIHAAKIAEQAETIRGLEHIIAEYAPAADNLVREIEEQAKTIQGLREALEKRANMLTVDDLPEAVRREIEVFLQEDDSPSAYEYELIKAKLERLCLLTLESSLFAAPGPMRHSASAGGTLYRSGIATGAAPSDEQMVSVPIKLLEDALTMIPEGIWMPPGQKVVDDLRATLAAAQKWKPEVGKPEVDPNDRNQWPSCEDGK